MNIERINELARKEKTERLSPVEKKEQQRLRKEYIDAVKKNLRSQLNHINIQELDGSITNLGEKHERKKED